MECDSLPAAGSDGPAKGHWRARWTFGRCGRCGERKRIFQTHGRLHSLYPHLCGACYGRIRAALKGKVFDE